MAKTNSHSKRSLGKVERADLKVTRMLSLDPKHPLGRWTRRFAELGDQPPLVALSLAVVATGAARRDERLMRTGLRMLAAHSLSTVAKLIGKNLIDRTRPGALNTKGYRLEQGESRDGRLRSMPSGHSAGIVAIAGAIVADYPRALLPVTAASATVGAAQLPSRNHYLTDVVAGAAIGLIVAGLARRLVPPYDRTEQAR